MLVLVLAAFEIFLCPSETTTGKRIVKTCLFHGKVRSSRLDFAPKLLDAVEGPGCKSRGKSSGRILGEVVVAKTDWDSTAKGQASGSICLHQGA